MDAVILNRHLPPSERFAPVLTFTRQEFRVFELLGQGLVQQEIAVRPDEPRSFKTINTYVTKMKDKAKISSTSRLVVYAAHWLESGLSREINHQCVKYKFTT